MRTVVHVFGSRGEYRRLGSALREGESTAWASRMGAGVAFWRGGRHIIEKYRDTYNTIRIHGSFGSKAPAALAQTSHAVKLAEVSEGMLPAAVADSADAIAIRHSHRRHPVENLAANPLLGPLSGERSSPHLRPDWLRLGYLMADGTSVAKMGAFRLPAGSVRHRP